jgi:hypothetical protein
MLYQSISDHYPQMIHAQAEATSKKVGYDLVTEKPLLLKPKSKKK